MGQLRFDFDSTAIRPAFDSHFTEIRSFDDLRFDRVGLPVVGCFARGVSQDDIQKAFPTLCITSVISSVGKESPRVNLLCGPPP